MSYFQDQFRHLRLPLGDGGLRRAQWGALGAIGAHFSLRDDPAVISMPTGSGKTAVMAAAAFLLRANRVLVLTPSRLVRGQIAEDFENLSTLRNLGVVTRRLVPPRVHEVVRQIRSANEWDDLGKEADVVVAVPRGLGPAVTRDAVPPPDFFDVILVDEAHHSAADEWTAVLDAFPAARRLLFTATPFRRDQLEIRGRFIYSYPLARALEDGVFGRITYIPVETPPGTSEDVSVAKAAEKTFQEDRVSGLSHCVMVRSDSKDRVRELKKLYDEHTGLRLETITSDESLGTIRRKLGRLAAGEIDGVICVNMMGEGFNFPRLKIAAVHSPFKSLAVTLQFVGRFARTNDPTIGAAKFLSAPSAIEVERRRLYAEGAVWEEMFAELAEAEVDREIQLREHLETFEDRPLPPGNRRFDGEDLSLRALRPYFHVKIYRPREPVDIARDVTLPAPYTVVKHEVSPEFSAAILIVERVDKPEWIVTPRFQRVSYDLVIVYYDAPTGLFFVSSSQRRKDVFYKLIADRYAPTGYRPLPASRLHRVRSSISEPNVYSLGMAARVPSRSLASYQTLMGPAVHNVPTQRDGRLFNTGHAFMGGKTESGTRATLGLSSASKVWSQRTDYIPGLIAWCNDLAGRIEAGAIPVTGTSLDTLGLQDEVAALPAPAIAAEWPMIAYEDLPAAQYRTAEGDVREISLVMADLEVDLEQPALEPVRVTVTVPGLSVDYEYVAGRDPHFTKVDPEEEDIVLPDDDLSLEQYLNLCPPTLYLADLSCVTGGHLSPRPQIDIQALPLGQAEGWDWLAAGVDVTREYWADGTRVPGRPLSIHDYLADRLLADVNKVVFYDHDSGEMADFVVVAELEGETRISMYHCKAFKPRKGQPAKPGARAVDAYEVVGQAIKSVKWFEISRVLEQMETREPRVSGDRFLKGSIDDMREFARRRRPAAWEVVVVQPGFQIPLGRDLPEIIGGGDAYVRSQGGLPLRVIGSA